jgi:nitroreductase
LLGFIKQLRRLRSRLLGRSLRQDLKSFDSSNVSILSSTEILAFARHDAHRIEKSFYNRIFHSKREYYDVCRKNVLRAVGVLKSRGFNSTEPTLLWAEEIANRFDHLEAEFIERLATKPKPINLSAAGPYLALVSSRRSSRVWAADQQSSDLLHKFALQMIDAARWAPNSGNRQPWRFRILSEEEKSLLKGLKEEHCYSAPCVIFAASDRRVYGGLGREEAAIFIDAGAAIMQMVLLAHACGYGVCWNHLSQDLIDSRPVSKEAYTVFSRALGLPEYVEPIAVIAFGVASFHPPTPPRMDVESLLI